MKESVTYQAILEEGEAIGFPIGKAIGFAIGKAKAIRDGVLRQGGRRLGPPDSDTVARLEAITDHEQLFQLTDRLLDVATWEELLAA